MSDTSSIATRTFAWKVRHSAWLLAVAVGFGSFSCIGFIYCAVRVRSAVWKRRAVVVTVLSLVGVVLLLSPAPRNPDVGGGYAAILWLVLIGYGLFVNREYLQWRSDQEPATPITAPPEPVDPVTAASTPVAPAEDEVPARAESPVAGPEGEGPARAEAPVAPAEDEVPARTDAPVASPEDEVPTRQEASDTPPEGVSVSERDEQQVEATPDELDVPAVFSWQQAEALAAWHMQKLGFDDAAMSPPGADGGLDVLATNAVAQVKHHATPIGAPVIQQLRGAAHGQGAALFYSLSGYTKAAVEYANNAAVALFTYNESGVVQPVNHAADLLHDLAGGDEAFDPTDFENQAQYAAFLQQYFDIMAAKFFEVAKQALAAANGNKESLIFRSLDTELARVKAIIHSLPTDGSRVSSDRFIDASSAIGEAAVRLADDLQKA